MKRLLGLALIFCSLSLTAFAAKNTQNLTLTRDLTVGSAKLTAGNYKVSWTGTEPNVQVTIVQNGKTLATVPAQLAPEKNDANYVEIQKVNGTDTLQVIHFTKMKFVISTTASGM